MPTFEFFGYTQGEVEGLIDTIRKELRDVPFSQDCVFVVSDARNKVISWDEEMKPFIRVLTRSAERAEAIRQRLNHYSDIEIVMIGFHPKTSDEIASSNNANYAGKLATNEFVA